MSYTPKLELTSGVEPESPGSQPSTLPLSYASMVRWLILTATKLSKTGVPIGGMAPPHGLEPRSSHSKCDILPLDEGGNGPMRDLNPRHLA